MTKYGLVKVRSHLRGIPIKDLETNELEYLIAKGGRRARREGFDEDKIRAEILKRDTYTESSIRGHYEPVVKNLMTQGYTAAEAELMHEMYGTAVRAKVHGIEWDDIEKMHKDIVGPQGYMDEYGY
jgi:hypothetical protein